MESVTSTKHVYTLLKIPLPLNPNVMENSAGFLSSMCKKKKKRMRAMLYFSLLHIGIKLNEHPFLFLACPP